MKVCARAKIFLWTAAGLLALLFACLFLPAARTQANAAVAEDDLSLLLPSSYEQYLGLTSPSSVAMSDDFIVIADGNKLFVYDRAAGVYSEYAHLGDHAQGARTVSKVQIYELEGKDRIYFSDEDSHIFEYTGGAGVIVDNVPCSTFLIDSSRGYLFTASASAETGNVAINRYSLASANVAHSGEAAPQPVNGNSPNLSLDGDTLYCSGDGSNVVAYDAVTLERQGAYNFIDKLHGRIGGLKAICVYRGELYFTVNATSSDPDYPNGIYKSVDGTASSVFAGDGFSALSVYGDEMYCICKNAVRKLSFSEEGISFSDYEIAAASSSVNRLSGATDIARAGELVVTADAGNRRISVFRTRIGGASSYTAVPCAYEGVPYTPVLVATDGDLIAVSDDVGFVYLYRASGEFLYRHDLSGTPATGLTCVYGNTYFVTEHAYGKAEEGVLSVERSGHGTNVSLASDLYGDLYVVYNDGTVGKFAERDFLDNTVAAQKRSFTVPGNARIRADFEGNVYYLQQKTLYKNGEELAVLPDRAFVYGGDGDLPLSVAIGFEDDMCYFLYGNYILRTGRDVIDIPTLNEISAAGVPGSVFAVHGEEDLLVDIPAGTIGIRTDLQKLREETPPYFPYLSHYRTDADKRGILLAQKDGYSLVILYEEDRTFTATLFRAHAAVPQEEYWTEGETLRYLTNDLSSYFFPCLHPALQYERLTRGTEVRTLGTVSAPERDYALVRYSSEEGERTGFVPVAYLTDVRPHPADAARYEHGFVKASEEGVRFVAGDGEETVVTERTPARLTDNGDGTFTAQIVKDGKTYTAVVGEDMIDRGESDALRISLIVILTVLAVVIMGVYVYLVPWKYRHERQKNGKSSRTS